MKKLLLFVFAAIAFAACTQNDVEELSSNRVYLPDEISVGFENNDETRVQLYEGKSVWNAGDLVTVFYKTLDNLMWKFQGEDGDRTGQLKMIEGSVGKQKMSEVVVVYPYNQDYLLAINNRSVEAKMPAKQEYRYESYDPASNLMIATSEGRDFVLRNACGWLKIELTGDGQQVEKLTLRGNNGETVAGDVTIDWDSSKATFISNGTTDPDDTEVGGSLVFDEASYDKLELNCHSAVLSSEPTAFYFTLPEQRFVDGITVEVKCRGYEPMVLSTDDAVEIKRNHIKPMAVVEFEAEESSSDAYFEFENIVTSTIDNTITLDVIPSVKDMTYIVLCSNNQYIIDNELFDDYALFADDYSYFEWICSFYGISVLEYMNTRARIGDSYNVMFNNEVYAGDTYMVYAYYFDSTTGARLSDISRYYITVEETVEENDGFEINLTVSNITATSATIEAVPNSDNNRYMCRVVTKMELEAFNILDNDLEIFRYIFDNPNSHYNYIYRGAISVDYSLAPEIEYIVVAFNFENYEEVYNGETEVRLFRKEFETPRGEQVDPNSLFTVSNIAVSYDNFSLDVTPLKGENSYWSYYIWTKRSYEETLNNEDHAKIVMRSYWGLNNIGMDYGYYDFGTFIKEYMGQYGSSQISSYAPLKNDTEYVVVLFYMDPEALDPTVVYDHNYVAVEFKTLAPSADDYATLEVTGPSIEAADNKYNIHFNVKTNDKAADIKVGVQLWANYDFEQYWDETDWSQIQAFFFFRQSVGAESLVAAKTAEGATIAFNDVDKDDYVFFFEVLNENNTPTQYAIRVTPEMFE